MKEPYRKIISPRRRRISFRIAPDGVLEIHTPPGVDDPSLELVIARCRRAIDELKTRAERTRPPLPEDGVCYFYRGGAYPVRTSFRIALFDEAFLLPAGDRATRLAALEKIYRTAASSFILPRAATLAKKYAVPVKKWSISGATGRYGSFSSSGHCTFSWRLVQFPDDMIDYVICHELAHYFELNHSAAFYAVLEKFFPGAGQKRREMNYFARNHKLF